MMIRHDSTTLTGAGPHVLGASTPDTTLFAPGPGTSATATLPDMTSFVDGVDRVFVVSGVNLGAAVVTVAPLAGQTVGGSSGTFALREGDSITLRADYAASDWHVVARVAGVPATLALYVATTGDDTNPGTAALPLLTIDAAVALAAKTGSRGFAHVNVGVGTFTLGASVMTVPCAGSIGGEPLAIVGTLVDSGLGARSIASSTVGSQSTVTYGTITDSVGGFTVNAYRDMWIRLTGAGAQVGKRFLIVGNTTSAFTVAGLFVAVTTETFVVEQPGTIVRWPLVAGTADAILDVAQVLGVQNVRLDGQGGSSVMRIRGGGALYHQGCQWRDWGSIQIEDAQVNTIIATVFSNSFPSLGTLNTYGSSFVSATPGAVVVGSRGAGVDYQSCLVRMRTNFANGVAQSTLTAHQGDAGVRVAGGGNLALGAAWFDAVTAIASDKPGNPAAIVADGASVVVLNTRVDACTGAALVMDHADGKVQGLQGVGNAGVPVVLSMNATLRNSLANSVTGAVPGNDVQVGGNALPSAWAVVNAGLVNDLAVGAASQLCVASS